MAFFTKRYHPPGTSPGTLTEMPADQAIQLKVHLIDYTQQQFTVLEDIDPVECQPYLQRDSVTWVHLQGHPTEAALLELQAAFDLHPLALEDVLNSGQRPKLEPFDDQLFIVMSMPVMKPGLVEVQQVSIFLSSTFVISFCEGDFAPFQQIVDRLRETGSRLRSRGSDFLLYGLLDLVIDQGFPVLEDFGLQMEDLEEQILRTSDGDTLERIHTIKRELILLRRMLWPHREVINQLLRDDHEQIDKGTMVYLRDCYDHTIQLMDLLETYRDMTGSMLDIYLSSINNRMNEVIRVLTVIATIFIPLTFITGIYGMNFDRTAGFWNMPELGLPYGYLLVWLLMAGVVAFMLFYFRRRKWF